MVSDVDGTLITPDKVLTERAAGAVGRLRDAGIAFAITSGRPPRGMSMLVEPLDLQTPLAAFNGGLFVDRDLSVIEQRTVPRHLVLPVIRSLESFGLGVWVYRGSDWFVRDLDGPHVEREARTVAFEPQLTRSFDDLVDDVAKIVGVHDDHELVERAAAATHAAFGDHVSASRSQAYYLDVTHPDANKGAVVRYLSALYGIPIQEIATIGDMPNDVLMFAHAGLSIAMGNASMEVQRAARRITTSNQEEGFAEAVDRFVLRTASV
jgi:Cof subfamily protein (haloacid dehalogenase superfamily)